MKTKAVALISGGLDSILAVKLMESLGIKVYPINFSTPFWQSISSQSISNKIQQKISSPTISKGEKFYKPTTNHELKTIYPNLKTIDTTKPFLKIIRKPKHGYGKNINPCIDCKIFMLRQAEKYRKKIKADFIFTGEVLGQRPMSQNYPTLKLIEKESKLQGKLLRPLSAKLLPITGIEKKGLVDRNKLLNLQGRSRKQQLQLAQKYKIKIFSMPAGGCLLTDQNFAKKLRDLFKHQEQITKQDIELLKIGRHFRTKDTKIIVGRNHKENQIIEKIKPFLVVPKIGSPSAIIQGKINPKTIKLAAELTASYSDAQEKQVTVKYGKKTIKAKKINKEKFKKYLL